MTIRKRLGWNFLSSLILCLFLVPAAPYSAGANDALDLEPFLDGKKTASFMEMKFTKPKKSEQVIAIMASLESPMIDMMLVFKDDRCAGQLRHSNGNGSFKLTCLGGGEIKSTFNCSSKNQCYMRGKHSQRGKFIFNFKHRPRIMTLAEIQGFAEQIPPSGTQVARAPQSNTAAGTVSPAVSPVSPAPSMQVTAGNSEQANAGATTRPASSDRILELRQAIAETLQKSGGFADAIIFGREKMEGYLFVDITEREEWKQKVVLVAGHFECLSQPKRDQSVATLRCLNGDEYLGVARDVGEGARVTGAFRDYGDAKIVVPSFKLGNLKDFLKNVDRAAYDRIAALADPTPTAPKAEQPVQIASASPGIQLAQTADAGGASSSAPVAAAVPIISISGTSLTGARGVLEGSVSDADGIAELRINGRVTQINSDGRFAVTTFVPIGGADVVLEAFNLAGLSTTRTVRLERADSRRTALSFEQLNPLKRKATGNSDAIALIIGVADYASAAAPAIYADTDAQVFHDYAAEKLGVPTDRIKMLINDAADEKGMLLAVKRWLTRVAKSGKSDVYVFFAGHGLATDDGEDMYLLPYDGTPELLEKTAILRDELFRDIAATSPLSVTIFLDTCYSGATRGSEMLIASRPIAIRAKEKAIPNGFTLITAAAGDETAKPLEEAKHGMFSYFLMKGMEGEADSNQDNQITTGELHTYVQQNVIQQSSGSQTPEIQGDIDRVLVRFQ